jgi:pyruvate/2-oxoglutarate dehydrogenase complex dihydrolipoamide dehydrogenase (E3) component
VGLEFAQLFRRLGSNVTVIQRGKQLLPREDPEVAKCMLDILEEDGLTIHLETAAQRASSSSPNSIKLVCSSKDGEISVTGSHLLVATGRIPNSDMLNLKATGVQTNSKGYIISNEKLETTSPNIYVLGDVKGPPAFTHISYDDFRIIQANHITKSGPELTTTNRIVPYVVYTDPQLGHVGLHEHEARIQFPTRHIQTATMPMAYVARALETDESRGMMKAVIDADSGEILGFTCLGIEGGELMSVVQMAMMGKVHYTTLQNAVWSHPALAESLNNVWGFLK